MPYRPWPAPGMVEGPIPTPSWVPWGNARSWGGGGCGVMLVRLKAGVGAWDRGWLGDVSGVFVVGSVVVLRGAGGWVSGRSEGWIMLTISTVMVGGSW